MFVYAYVYFAHENIIDGFCKMFIIFNFSVSLKRTNLYLTFKYKMSVVFYIFTVIIKYTAKTLTIIWFICSNLVDQE